MSIPGISSHSYYSYNPDAFGHNALQQTEDHPANDQAPENETSVNETIEQANLVLENVPTDANPVNNHSLEIETELQVVPENAEAAVETEKCKPLDPAVVVKLNEIAKPVLEAEPCLKPQNINQPVTVIQPIVEIASKPIIEVASENTSVQPIVEVTPKPIAEIAPKQIIEVASENTSVQPIVEVTPKPIADITSEKVAGLAAAVDSVKDAIVPEETLAEKVQKIFSELLIKEWYLPGIGQASQFAGVTAHLNPVFSTETLRDIASIRAMINKSSESNGSAPIPNLVFVGKPGVGKTIAIQHLCESTGTPYVRIPSGAMEHHLKVSTAIPALHKIFDVVEMCKKPVYIVMDDGEELVAKRPPQSKVRYDSTTKAHWLVEKENFADTMQQRRTALVNAILEESGKDRRTVGFAITTNRAEIIDPAFMTRARVIEFNKPEIEQRKQIIIAHLPIVFGNDMKYLPFFHMGRLENMAQKTKGFTGRNLVKMLEALYACVQMEKGDIRQDMIDACICEQENAIKISDDAGPLSFKFPKAEIKAVTNKLKECVVEKFNNLKISTNKALDKLTA